MEKLDPNPWLQLGLGGGALFLVAFVILACFLFLMKNNSGTKIDKLCDKIDKLVEAFYESNKCVSDMSMDTSNKYDNIKDNQDKQYNLLQKVYEAVTEIKAGMVKEGDK